MTREQAPIFVFQPAARRRFDQISPPSQAMPERVVETMPLESTFVVVSCTSFKLSVSAPTLLYVNRPPCLLSPLLIITPSVIQFLGHHPRLVIPWYILFYATITLFFFLMIAIKRKRGETRPRNYSCTISSLSPSGYHSLPRPPPQTASEQGHT